ncbi:MAG: TetR/AcrR family transcriptional regulator [Bdellovibrionales bacterium]|nr:TetR/AcrR family transcriptional regulator [Bdellovibrionales bacterium]
MSDSSATVRTGGSASGQREATASADEGTATELGPRERILQAALELFVEQGYFNTNVPDISKRSRCSVGSIYHHFLNKEEIAAQLYRDGILRFREALSESIDPEEDPEKTIRSIVIAFMRFAEEHHLLSRYLWLARHNEFLSDRVRRPTTVGFDELGRRLTKVIKKAVRGGDIPPVKAEVFWSIVFGIPLSYVRDWLDGYTTGSPSGVSASIASACWAGLQGLRN